MTHRWLAALFGMLSLCGGAVAQPSAPSGLMALPQVTSPRLYVLDCGTIISNRPEVFGVTRDDVFNPNFKDTCFLVMHPRGTLLFDTGLPDSHVGRPIYEGMVGYEGILKTTTLTGELAAIGVTAPMITYFAISHSHWDHVGNGSDYAGSTWLARKPEYDFMFASSVPAAQKAPYAALEHAAEIKFIEGDYDVFGDGTVVLMSTPGHTPGHQSLYLKLAHTGPVVITGDLYHYPAERKLDRMPARERSTGTPESRKRIEDFVSRNHAQLWISHNIDWYRDAVKSPGWYD